jgi:large conductance mechanosensitive channel protein
MAAKTEKSSKVQKVKRVVSKEREVAFVIPEVRAPKVLQGFVDFVREQGVVGLAVGLILGFAAKSLVDSAVNNLFNPIVGFLTGGVSLENKTWCITKDVNDTCATNMGYGQFISDLISFLVVVLLVYMVFKMLKLERLDKKKD